VKDKALSVAKAKIAAVKWMADCFNSRNLVRRDALSKHKSTLKELRHAHRVTAEAIKREEKSISMCKREQIVDSDQSVRLLKTIKGAKL
jgi:hypothetical protein